jgi:hypothetical protein
MLASCAGGANGPVVEGNRRTSGENAVIFGELAIEGDCLHLVWSDSDARFPVIWPHGTSWDAERSAVVLARGALVQEGDRVDGGGGYHSDNLSDFTVPDGVDLLAACVDNEYRELAVFNSSDNVDIQP